MLDYSGEDVLDFPKGGIDISTSNTPRLTQCHAMPREAGPFKESKGSAHLHVGDQDGIPHTLAFLYAPEHLRGVRQLGYRFGRDEAGGFHRLQPCCGEHVDKSDLGGCWYLKHIKCS